jgi:hypothetical protein
VLQLQPTPSTMYTRIQKKIQACSQKKYQSYYGSKSHAPDVCFLVHSLLESLDDYTKTDPKLVVDGCYAIVSSFVETFKDFNRPGYCEGLEMSVETIVRYAVDDIPRNLVSSNDWDKLANIMIEWQNVASPYGVLDNYPGFDMKKSANLIRNGRGSDDEEENKKPVAVVAVTAVVQAPISKQLNGSPDTAATEPSTGGL